MNKVDLKALCLALVIALLTVSICCPVVFAAGEDADRIDEIIAGMSLSDKLAQMMFFSPRTWKADYTPVETDENGQRKKIPPGSTAFVPGVSGLIIAGEIIKDIAGGSDAR